MQVSNGVTALALQSRQEVMLVLQSWQDPSWARKYPSLQAIHDIVLVAESKVQSVQLAVLALQATHVLVLSRTYVDAQLRQFTLPVPLLKVQLLQLLTAKAQSMQELFKR